MPAPPSVIWLQSKRRNRPSIGGFASSSASGSGTVQSRVCAFGLARALAKFSWAIARRWVVVEAVAAVVLVGDSVEHVRPHELGVGALVAGPRGGAEVLRGGVAGHGLLQFDADDERRAVCAGPQIGHRRQGRDAARRARGFVAGRGGVPQAVVHGGGHRAEVALPGEHLAEGVADVDHVDVGGVDLGRAQRVVDDLGGQIGEVEAFAGEVAGEIALIAAEDPDVRSAHGATVLQLRE